MGIKVYGAESRPQCQGAKQYLKSKGVDFEYADVFKDEAAMKELEQLGAMSLPVIKCGDETVMGFNVKKLEQ